MSQDAVADELAIRDLVARYAQAVTHRDEAAWGATWAKDGEWSVMGREAKGREAAVALWNELMGSLSFIVQMATTGNIQLAGDRATGGWTVTEHGKFGNGSPLFTIGLYDDVYVRSPEGWCFQSRAFRPLYAGPPDLSAPPIGGPS